MFLQASVYIRFVIISLDRISHLAQAQSQWVGLQIKGYGFGEEWQLSQSINCMEANFLQAQVRELCGVERGAFSPLLTRRQLGSDVMCTVKNSRVWQGALSPHCWEGGGSLQWVSHSMSRASLMFRFGPVVGVVPKYLVVYFEGPWGESSLAGAHYSLSGLWASCLWWATAPSDCAGDSNKGTRIGQVVTHWS